MSQNTTFTIYSEKPEIIIEELLLDNLGNIPDDIKCFCFHGKLHFIQVDYDRFVNHGRAMYDVSWNKIPAELHYPDLGKNIDKPENLNNIIEVSESLSQGFDFVRVDLYNINNKIYFGELTNYPGNGLEKFKPHIYDEKFGNLLNIG